jgi:hypothetical protein
MLSFQEVIVSTEETVRDYEHVEVLQKKLEDFAKDLDANENRIKGINQQADTLEVEGHPDIEVIQDKRTVIIGVMFSCQVFML